ncbi:MAG TPA: universal stress protein [Ignavibacteria bacterium]|nr:universal stress protein [Ignavibacteria bacterium]
MEPHIKKILVPIDFSDYSKDALNYAINFIKYFNAKLTLIYVIEPVIYPPDFSATQISIPPTDYELTKTAKESLEHFIEREIPSNIDVDTVIKTGKPFVEIIETAEEENIDLIIISSHGHSGIEKILFGSTAEKVVRKAPCPVLTLRTPIKGFNYNNERKNEK